MKHISKIFLLCALFIPQIIFNSPATPHEQSQSQTIQELNDGILVKRMVENKIGNLLSQGIDPRDIAVFFDIDNTLIKTFGGAIGSDQWFDWNMLSLQAQGKSKTQALDITLEALTKLQPHIIVEPVDEQMLTLINELQEQGIRVAGLTARGGSFARVTLRQLKDVNVNFRRNYAPQSKWMHNFSLNMRRPARYVDGIIFTGGGHKGKALFKFLKTVKYTPKYIFFIDDKEKNTRNVQESVVEHRIPATLIHYTETHPEVEQYMRMQEILARA